MAYFTLCTRDEDGTWSPQFGDRDRATVYEERLDYRREYRGQDLRILKTKTAHAHLIRAAVAKLNQENAQ